MRQEAAAADWGPCGRTGSVIEEDEGEAGVSDLEPTGWGKSFRLKRAIS